MAAPELLTPEVSALLAAVADAVVRGRTQIIEVHGRRLMIMPLMSTEDFQADAGA